MDGVWSLLRGPDLHRVFGSGRDREPNVDELLVKGGEARLKRLALNLIER
jgi:hypothetical protein